MFDGADPDRLSDTQLLAAAWKHVPPTPVESSWPLFVLYTSGSTGKPKGIVHTHGGYQVGLCATVRLVFDLRPESDLICVVATAGWITGQSYMIGAALLSRTPSVKRQQATGSLPRVPPGPRYQLYAARRCSSGCPTTMGCGLVRLAGGQ